MTAGRELPTVDDIRARIAVDARWVQRGIVAIYRYQTADEQSRESTNHDNGVGFNGTDARILSSFAKQILGLEAVNKNTGRMEQYPPRPLSQKQLAVAFKLMPKYARQLHRIATTEPHANRSLPPSVE